jgi:hypothetical protein
MVFTSYILGISYPEMENEHEHVMIHDLGESIVEMPDTMYHMNMMFGYMLDKKNSLD